MRMSSLFEYGVTCKVYNVTEYVLTKIAPSCEIKQTESYWQAAELIQCLIGAVYHRKSSVAGINLLVSDTGPRRRLNPAEPTINGGEMEPGLRSLRGSLGDSESDRFAAYPRPGPPLLRIA